MYERFTDRVRQAMQLANKDAQRLNRESIGTDSILLGLVEATPGIAMKVLSNLGVDISELVRVVKELRDKATLESSQSAKRVIEIAMQELRSFDHDYLGSEHLLLGLMHDATSISGQVLTGLGLTVEKVREEIVKVLGDRPR